MVYGENRSVFLTVIFAGFLVLTTFASFGGFFSVSANSEKDFDYWVLSLSWAPSFCLSPAGSHSPNECGKGVTHYGFVVHGLWPDVFSGSEPENCHSGSPSVPSSVVSEMSSIMPSPSLISHEWKKHGRCTGLSAEGYFGLIKKQYQSLNFPFTLSSVPLKKRVKDIRSSFISLNPGLHEESVIIKCASGDTLGLHLTELRICYDRDLSSISCPVESRRTSCREDKMILVPYF